MDLSDDDTCMTLAELHISLYSVKHVRPKTYHPPSLRHLSDSDSDPQQVQGWWGMNDVDE